jgi:MtN3 and saliva related transmembrane protein
MLAIRVTIEVIGFAAGIFTTLAVVPQLLKSWRTKQVVDISPFMFICIMCGVGVWVVYGILKNDYPIIFTNGLSFILNFSMLMLFLRYRSNS